MSKFRIVAGSVLALSLCGCGFIQQCAVGKTVTQTVNIDTSWQNVVMIIVALVVLGGLTALSMKLGGGKGGGYLEQ